MDASNVVATAFRLLAVILGPILALMVYNLYRKTKGGSRGWLYMTVAFIALGLWSLSQLLFTVFDSFAVRTVMAFLFFGMVSFFNPLAAVRLARDMKVSLPRWLTERNVVIAGLAVFIIMIVINIQQPNILGMLASVSLFALTPMFLLAFVAYDSIASQTKLRIWSLWGWGSVAVLLGALLVGVGYTDCCSAGMPLAGVDGCVNWAYDYVPVLPLPCAEADLPVASNGVVFIGVGLVMMMYSAEKLRRAMKG